MQKPLRKNERAGTHGIDISYLLLPAVSSGDDAEELDESDDDLEDDDDADFDVSDVEEFSDSSENSS